MIELIFFEVLLLALIVRYVGATIGMGYGTVMTPLLLLVGFSPLQVIPAILLSQFISGIFAAFLHHGAGNVFFDFNNDPEHRIVKSLGKLGYIPKSNESKVAFVLIICSIIGVIGAAFVAVNLTVFYLKLYIGLIVVAMGLIITLKNRIHLQFSWTRIIGIGVLASFNKGVSGGGYGPLITSGQILSGINAKSSIGITALSEGITCFAGVIAFIYIGKIDWTLSPYLVIGSIIAIPASVSTVKKMHLRNFSLAVGLATTLLGIMILMQIFK